MKTLIAPVLSTCVCVGVVLADSPNAQSQDPAVVETLKKFEQNVGDAMVARDIDKLSQFYAEDWATIGSAGKIFTRESLLSDFKSWQPQPHVL